MRAGSRHAGDLGPAAAPARPCCSPGATGPAPSSPTGSASPPAPSATTWTGCAGSAIPVDARPGVAGGYRLGAGGALPPLLLDDDEAVAVAIGLRTAASGSVAGIEETSVRALAKLQQMLPSRLRHRVSAFRPHGAVPVTRTRGSIRTS